MRECGVKGKGQEGQEGQEGRGRERGRAVSDLTCKHGMNNNIPTDEETLSYPLEHKNTWLIINILPTSIHCYPVT